MQYRSVGPTLGVSQAKKRPPPRVVSRAPGVIAVEPPSRRMDVAPCEVGPVSVEYLLQGARVTDIDRFVAPEADGLRDGRSANQEERDRDGMRRASTAMTNPAEQRDRAGRANPYPEEYQ